MNKKELHTKTVVNILKNEYIGLLRKFGFEPGDPKAISPKQIHDIAMMIIEDFLPRSKVKIVIEHIITSHEDIRLSIDPFSYVMENNLYNNNINPFKDISTNDILTQMERI